MDKWDDRSTKKRSLNYGIDDSGPLPDQQTHTVDVPETLCLLALSVKQSFLDDLRSVEKQARYT